jgi:hypothetical protein
MASFIAAVICSLMMTIQPLYLRTFINQAKQGVSSDHLGVIIIFMVASAGFAYVFDMISVSIRASIRLKLRDELRKVYAKHCRHHNNSQKNLAYRGGLDSLAEIALLSSLDSILILFNLALIVCFMSLESPVMATIACLFFVVSGLAITSLCKKMGRIGNHFELGNNNIINKDTGNFFESARRIDRRLNFESDNFIISSKLVFLSFFIFRVVPLFILVLFTKELGVTLGSLASIFLYFNLLHGPFKKMTLLLKSILVNFGKTEQFRNGLTAGLNFEAKMGGIPSGLILVDDCFGGDRISNQNLFQKDHHSLIINVENSMSKDLQVQMVEASHRFPIILNSQDPKLQRLCHFKISHDGQLKPNLMEAG